jgi:hypothetical protein
MHLNGGKQTRRRVNKNMAQNLELVLLEFGNLVYQILMAAVMLLLLKKLIIIKFTYQNLCGMELFLSIEKYMKPVIYMDIFT